MPENTERLPGAIGLSNPLTFQKYILAIKIWFINLLLSPSFIQIYFPNVLTLYFHNLVYFPVTASQCVGDGTQ